MYFAFALHNQILIFIYHHFQILFKNDLFDLSILALDFNVNKRLGLLESQLIPTKMDALKEEKR